MRKWQDFINHLKHRGGDFIIDGFNCYIDFQEEVVTFPLWTTNGKMCGYQRYDWKADKLKNNNLKGKYYTYRDKNILSYWGSEYLITKPSSNLYVVEGIWDAISVINTGRRCVATLSNNPKFLKQWLRCLPCKTIALCDGDSSGKKLAGCCDTSTILPDNSDCIDFNTSELDYLLRGYGC